MYFLSPDQEISWPNINNQCFIVSIPFDPVHWNKYLPSTLHFYQNIIIYDFMYGKDRYIVLKKNQ